MLINDDGKPLKIKKRTMKHLKPGKAKPKGVRKGNKVQISLTITEELLEKVNRMAKENGQTRAGFINLAISLLVDRGIDLGDRPTEK